MGEIVQNEEQLQNNGIVNLIKNNFNDFLTEFFTVATTKERENLAKNWDDIETNKTKLETLSENRISRDFKYIYYTKQFQIYDTIRNVYFNKLILF